MSKKYILYRNGIIIFSIITFLLSLIIDKNQGYIFIPFIPLCFLFMFVFSKKIHRYSSKYRGMLLLNIFMVIKYIFAIFLICLFRDFEIPSYYAVGVSDKSFQLATLYIIVEMISIFITIELFSSKFYDKKISNKEKNTSIKYGPILICFLLVASLYALLNFNSFIGKSQILISKNNSLTETIEVSNFQYLLFYSFKMIVMGLLINKFIKKYKETEKGRYILLSYLVIIIYSLLNISTSRVNIILPFVFFFLLTSNIFKNKAKFYNAIMIVLLCVIFSIVSVYKNPWKYTDSDKVVNNIVEFFTDIQEYTSSMLPTAVGIQAIDYYKNEITLYTLFNDFFGSVPGLSRYINANNRIYRYYNLYALNGSSMSQIIPMTISSAAYFSPFLCFLLVDLCVILLMFFEKKIVYDNSNFLNNYLYIYLLFIFASCLNSNVQMLAGRIFSNFAPTFLILTFNQKFILKKGE